MPGRSMYIVDLSESMQGHLQFYLYVFLKGFNSRTLICGCIQR